MRTIARYGDITLDHGTDSRSGEDLFIVCDSIGALYWCWSKTKAIEYYRTAVAKSKGFVRASPVVIEESRQNGSAPDFLFSWGGLIWARTPVASA